MEETLEKGMGVTFGDKTPKTETAGEALGRGIDHLLGFCSLRGGNKNPKNGRGLASTHAQRV